MNVALLVLLVPHGGANLGIAGAGIALCGAYVVMLVVMYLLTRDLFRVGFQWRRLAQLTAILAGVAVSGELLLPTSGFAGLALRAAWLCLVPVLLLGTRFFAPHEWDQARALVTDGRRRVAAFRARAARSRSTRRTPTRSVSVAPAASVTGCRFGPVGLKRGDLRADDAVSRSCRELSVACQVRPPCRRP